MHDARLGAGRPAYPDEIERERERIATMRERVDSAAERPRPVAVAASPQVQPPVYGAPQRDAISSVVDNVVQTVCAQITELRAQLDVLENQLLVSGAAAKDTLNQQVAVCMEVNEQTKHLAAIIGEVKQRVMRL
ncbi:hypothetical protein JQ581_30140 [Bradyrhizobium liaoningense]|uniref:hypothetical protein n=1 Tax=Bradyrhizobium liaoningense TaxID=43992 RepID=UPI001BAC5F65|nr:hypothetical protein [Bradyrhizobium liaoningense]MBR0741201.1 hypothetical protein [Bradyrhizobium liaoningense]